MASLIEGENKLPTFRITFTDDAFSSGSGFSTGGTTGFDSCEELEDTGR